MAEAGRVGGMNPTVGRSPEDAVGRGGPLVLAFSNLLLAAVVAGLIA